MNSIKKNFFYNALNQVLNIIIPLITMPYLTRILDAAGIGSYAYVNAIANYFVIVAMLGLNSYGSRAIAQSRDNKNKLSMAFCSIYSLQLITASLCIACYVLLFYENVLAMIMLLYVFTAVVDVNWFFTGLEKFNVIIMRNLTVKILSTICIFTFVHSKDDLYLYSAIMSSSLFLAHLSVLGFVRKYIYFYKPTFSDIIVHLKPNLILFIPVISVSIYKILDKIMLGFYTNNIEVGYFECAEKIVQVPIAFVVALGTVMLPRVSNLIANGNVVSGEKYFKYSVIFSSFIVSAFSFGIMGVSDLFIPIYYGNGYEESIEILNILAMSCIFVAMANVIRTQIIIPFGYDSIFVKSVVFGAVINCISNFFLISKWGGIGAAIGTLVAEIIVCLYQYYMVHRKQAVVNVFIYSIPFLFSGIVMYFALLNISAEEVLVSILIMKVISGAFIYVVVLAIQYFLYAKKLLNL